MLTSRRSHAHAPRARCSARPATKRTISTALNPFDCLPPQYVTYLIMQPSCRFDIPQGNAQKLLRRNCKQPMSVPSPIHIRMTRTYVQRVFARAQPRAQRETQEETQGGSTSSRTARLLPPPAPVQAAFYTRVRSQYSVSTLRRSVPEISSRCSAGVCSRGMCVQVRHRVMR